MSTMIAAYQVAFPGLSGAEGLQCKFCIPPRTVLSYSGPVRSDDILKPVLTCGKMKSVGKGRIKPS